MISLYKLLTTSLRFNKLNCKKKKKLEGMLKPLLFPFKTKEVTLGRNLFEFLGSITQTG